MFPAASLVILSSAPGSSFVPLTAFLLSVTSVVFTSSNIVTTAELFPDAASTLPDVETSVTVPSTATSNITFEEISYPVGAPVSVSVYVPAGSFLNSVAELPVVHDIVLSLLINEALVPLILSVVNTISLLFLSFPVSVSFASASSSVPLTAFLLIFTSVVFFSYLSESATVSSTSVFTVAFPLCTLPFSPVISLYSDVAVVPSRCSAIVYSTPTVRFSTV